MRRKYNNYKKITQKEETENNNDADAVLSTADAEVKEELDNLSGYREYVREQYRLSED